jgi:hypothetical protein
MQNHQPKRVYVGLPDNLNVFWVARPFRTNPLSHIVIPGVPDVDVVVELQDGRAFCYDLIKYPYRYIRKFFLGEISYRRNSLSQIYFNNPVQNYVIDFLRQERMLGVNSFAQADQATQLNLVKRVFARIFMRTYEDEAEQDSSVFEEVWNAQTSEILPWQNGSGFYPEDELFPYEVHKPQSTFEYYGYDMYSHEEDLVEKAERVWGIPDPRLVED